MTAIIPRIGIGRKQRRHHGGSGKQAQQFTHDWILRVKARVRITILVMKRSDWFKIKRWWPGTLIVIKSRSQKSIT